MHAPGSEVPFKARQFYQHLHHLKGRPAATLSVYEHAYTLYAVVVEHLTPRVPLEQSTIDYARHWFGTN
jgi:hypothetical protein